MATWVLICEGQIGLGKIIRIFFFYHEYVINIKNKHTIKKKTPSVPILINTTTLISLRVDYISPMLTIQSSTLIVYPKPFFLTICSGLALVRDLESFDTLKYVNHKTQTNVTKPKRVSQTQNGITKHKTESHNLKQNHKT